MDLTTLVRPVLLVRGTKRATELLAQMRREGHPMALAVDEHGALIGLVAIEDLVEVIVGEIHDEHRVRKPLVEALPGGTIESDGSVPLHQLNDDYELTLPESSDYVTVAGLVLDRLGALPRTGESVEVASHDVTVLAMEGRRIARVRIRRLERDGAGAPDPGAPVAHRASEP